MDDLKYYIAEGTEIISHNRFGSFSINFNSSKKYARGNMYRVKIAKGVRVLYIPSLSFASHESEILHSINGVLSIDNDELEDSYNNKNNKWGILSHETEAFKSADITFEKYATGYNTEDIKKVLKSYKDKYQIGDSNIPPEIQGGGKIKSRKIPSARKPKGKKEKKYI